MTALEPLWKVADVARCLAMSPSWVYKEAEAGRLPCLWIGAALRFKPEEIRRYLEGLRVGRGGAVFPLRGRVASSAVDRKEG